MLLREEMRRVVRYLGWQAEWWKARTALRQELSAQVGAGVRAYALKQAAWHDRFAAFLRAKWNMSAVTAAQHLLAEEGALTDLFGVE
jgi:hypothetical protein